MKNLLFYILFGTQFVFGQLSLQLGLDSYLDDNLYRSPVAEQDQISRMDLDIHYQFLKADLSLHYNPDIILYNENLERNFSMHTIGLDYSKSFSENKYYLYAGGNGLYRVNGTEYDYYNYKQLYGYLNFRFDLNYLFLRIGYNYRNRDYVNFSDISNERHFFFAQINKSFPSKTTVIFEMDLGRKTFKGTQTYYTIYETYTESEGEYGKGKGKGRGQNTTTIDTTYNIETTILEPPVLDQAVFLMRITQSLYSKAGIYVQYRKQLSLTSETSYLNSDAYYQDEELFDDPFSYESDGLSSQLTWILPFSMRIRIGIDRLSKQYISEQAYSSAEDSLAGGGTRADNKTLSSFSISKNLKLDKTWINSLNLSLKVLYIRNESNSYWYDYKNLITGAGINVRF